MDKLKDLRDLLKHEIKDLYSAEEQILDAMPAMIEKANNPTLKQALEMHLQDTRTHKDRLVQVQELLGEYDKKEDTGFFAGLFGDSVTCKGMEGLINEGEKIMGEDMNPEVMDAAIIACAQKIEHYEICGYGTARAYARQLNLVNVAQLLEQTLDEEHQGDEQLTSLALGGLNQKAEVSNSVRGYGTDSYS
ncbi:ferritin-like domain-containing protein [Chitinophagaceae bacterium LB-8]|uniref:Ferritin-like domain-containing protein n=1 Tax=Paraflavisolibacter caeni TaxID=2982496 RepID=A0A9X2XPZ2_9BACT|nr:ferritin-like domain-containing protein [Paraflavisolibacter caeni]MCU7552194.1 ferritin-like domain-containing protein [Paraflavisolibacter caeni]